MSLRTASLVSPVAMIAACAANPVTGRREFSLASESQAAGSSPPSGARIRIVVAGQPA